MKCPTHLIAALLLFATTSATLSARAVLVPKAAGAWARQHGYYKTVQARRLPFAKFELTRCHDGTVIIIYGRGYIERLPGSHLWTQHLPPLHSSKLWLWRCVGANRRHLFFVAMTGPHWNSAWLCGLRAKGRPRMLTPVHGNGSAAEFTNGRLGAFTIGKHLVLTADGGRHWLPQPSFGAGKLYRLKWLNDGKLLVAGDKGTLLLRVHSDGQASVRSRGKAIPLDNQTSQYTVARFGWPDIWLAEYPKDQKKRVTFGKVDLANGKVLARYKLRQRGTFFAFHGGFVLVAPDGQNHSWLEVYRIRHGRAVPTVQAKADFWQMLEWRPHGEFVYNGDDEERLYQFNINTGKITPTSIRLKKWIVPPNPNSVAVIIHSKAWINAVDAQTKLAVKLRGRYSKRYLRQLDTFGAVLAHRVQPWKWMRATTALLNKLYAEQVKAKGQ